MRFSIQILVYRLARYVNLKRQLIPQASLEKPPSAELRPDQKDSDLLPPYEILDPDRGVSPGSLRQFKAPVNPSGQPGEASVRRASPRSEGQRFAAAV